MEKQNKQLPKIMQATDSYVVHYPQAIKAAQQQNAIIWFDTELGVEKDEGDIRTKLTAGERHGLETTLKLFTEYEIKLGTEFWGSEVMRMFPRPDIQRMASSFSFIELNVHAPFYSRINDVLNISTEEFYNSWKLDPILVDRMDYITAGLKLKNPLLKLASFTFMEGAVLFSNFAYLKSFNSGGFNMCSHIASGIDASAKDENFHAMGSAWLFNQTISEMLEMKLITQKEVKALKKKIRKIGEVVYQHELRIIEILFSKGENRTITEEEMKHFARNRVDVVLSFMNIEPLFGDEQGKVSLWFYKSLNTYKFSDFFANQQIAYTRNWNKDDLAFVFEQE